MAQDFGDDMGNALLNFVKGRRRTICGSGVAGNVLSTGGSAILKGGEHPELAKAMAEKQSSREQVVVPFGTSEEAAYYAQVCRENGTYAAAYTDKQETVSCLCQGGC